MKCQARVFSGIIILGLVSLGLAAVVGCDNSANQGVTVPKAAVAENAPSPAPSEATPTTPAPAEVATYSNPDWPIIRFGIPPWQKGQSVDQIRDLYKPMLDWLSEKIHHRFQFVGGKDYADIIELVAEGKVQLATLSPVPYVLATEKNPGIRLLVTELRNREDGEVVDSYGAYILALKTREDIKTIQDLKGKQLGFVKVESSSGFKYPNATLRKMGIIPDEFFSKVFFLGSHPRVTDAIAAGSIDAGCTWDYNWQQARAKNGDVFKIVLETPRIPNLCVVSHQSLPQNVSKQIQELLPNVPPHLIEKLSADGYAVRPDSFYDIVRTLVKEERAQGITPKE